MYRFMVMITCFTLSPLWAYASMSPMPGEERFQTLLGEEKQTLGAQIGMAGIEEDFFFQLTLRAELNLGPVGLGLQVPLNLRVYDRDPQNNNDYLGAIRREDWKTPADYIKIIRYVRFGNKRDFIYLRAGELAATLGHGTILGRYLNNLDVNSFRVGSEFDVNTDYGGVETIVGDYGTLYDLKNPNSRVLGLRGYVKPVAFADPESIFNIFSVGVSVVSDVNAPRVIATDAGTGQPLVENNQLKVDKTTAATVFGFDLEAEVLKSALLDIIPYTDLNFINQAGWGWHAGILLTAKMPVGFNLTIPVRFEYRRFRSDYIPTYFSTFYEIERYAMPGVAGSQPKLAMVRDLDSKKGINGYYGDLAFDFAGILQIGAGYEDYQGQNPNLQAFVSIPALEVIQFKAYYARLGIRGKSDIFKFDDRSMAVAEVRYEIISYLYLVGRASRRWALVTDEADKDYGQYKGTTDWKAGFEMAFSF